MVSLAQRVRDFRYSKGWGPDELANRAEISRTALYQIESGKTGLPRAATLRRIAQALEVSMDQLLGEETPSRIRPGEGFHRIPPRARETREWMPAEGGPLSLPPSSARGGVGFPEDRGGAESVHRASAAHEGVLSREGELMSKLHDLLHSPIGPGVARILDELHGLTPRTRLPR